MKCDILLGYSWGAAEAMLAAAECDEFPRGLILVSPYVFVPQVPPLKRAILQMPLLGRAILKAAGPKQLEKMAEKTASPAPVSGVYRRYCLALAEPEILAQALLEKHGKRERMASAISKIAKRGTPVLLVWGKGDLTSSEPEQIAPLRSALAVRQELRMDDAGHAIPWTHPGRLAQALDDFIGKI